jgi:2-amino-4-hydroxy-6-hydroxymethyldihydropteridine diphosphokinase
LKNSNSIFLSLGTNVGDKNKNLSEALTLLKEFVKILSVSSVYKTEPLLYEDQEDFLNIVTEIDYQGDSRVSTSNYQGYRNTNGKKKNF